MAAPSRPRRRALGVSGGAWAGPTRRLLRHLFLECALGPAHVFTGALLRADEVPAALSSPPAASRFLPEVPPRDGADAAARSLVTRHLFALFLFLYRFT